jgi:hypothetical protein
LVEASEIEKWDIDLRRCSLFRGSHSSFSFPGFNRGQRLCSLDHSLGTVEKILLTCFDRLTHARHLMLAHELQNLREPTGASDRTVDPFQFGAEVGEVRREQLPVPEDGRVVQRSRLSTQRCGVVNRIKDHLVLS